ncbi:MAG: nucleotidyltransferase domain-containing protein [Candidatus Micrarchaeota archaeon]
MGKKPLEIKPFIKRFISRLKKAFRIEKIILFGSRARGDYLVHSDYDLLIVSPDFEGRFFTQRSVDVTLKTDPDFNFEFLCYTPEEFEKKRKQVGIVRNAVKEGIALV